MSLHQGNTYELLKSIPDNSVDVILTDPPYNLPRGINGPSRDLPTFNPASLVQDFKRILKPKGNLFAFCGWQQIGSRHQAFSPLYDRMNTMIRHKTDMRKKVRKGEILYTCEFIMTMWDHGHVRNAKTASPVSDFMESGKCWGPERIKKANGRAYHPAQKPVKLLEHLIAISSKPGQIILDPFMGVGSTGVAAHNLGRKFIGIEQKREYIDHAIRRLE